MKITLNNPKEIKAPVIISEVTVERIIDLPQQRIVRVFISELNAPLILWEGDAYDQIGQWTDLQAEARILELLSV
jgi:hypothetical protein